MAKRNGLSVSGVPSILFKLLKEKASIIIIVLVALASGFASGWYVSGVFHKAKAAERLQTEIDNISAQYKGSLQNARKELQVASETVFRLSKQYENINKIKVKAEGEVIRYVQINNECDITRGAVRLLNQARGSGDKQAMLHATGIVDGQEHTSSTVTQRAEIEAHIECATQYGKLAAKNDALIDFITKQ